jgi:MGT family glycosyltransferase
MARILAYTSPGRSHVFVLTPILDELRARGHEIVLRTLASEVQAMCARGFDAEPIDPAVAAVQLEDWRARSQVGSLRVNARVFAARAAHDAPDLTQAIADTEPDALLVDINSWGALMAAEAWGGPWAAFCPYPLPLRSREVPPFGPGFAPARGPLGRLRDRVARPLVYGGGELQMRPAINRVRARLGLPPAPSVAQWLTQAPLLLYLTAEPFEYPRRDWPANVVMVGPCAWDPPAEEPPWLAEIAQPIVLVGTSTEYQNDTRLVRTALQALADAPYTVVATLPTGDPSGLNAPPNARIARFLPHTPLLRQAVCFVTHGGMGSTQKALAHGVPVCAVPFGRDQHEVARRVVVAGAGTRLPARRLRADRLLVQVEQAIGCAQGAQRMAGAFRDAGGAGAAADAFTGRLLGTTVGK